VDVKVGGSGVNVNVSVDSCKVGEASTEAATWVNPATTVCAAEVLIASESCKVMVGIAQAKILIDNVIIVRETRLAYDIATPYSLQIHLVWANLFKRTHLIQQKEMLKADVV